MNKDKLIEMGFKLYAEMHAGGDLKHGVELKYIMERNKAKFQPVVYCYVSIDGYIIYIGQSSKADQRFHVNYRMTKNETNDRIRAHVKNGNNLFLYVLPLKVTMHRLPGWTQKFPTWPAPSIVEECLINEYKKANDGKYPPLNVNRNHKTYKDTKKSCQKIW